ncbi:MAG: hypothetical protein CML67_01955 [Rhodobacteraceae bacterium]|nr:hypothetical protein [Paracoccaceae bacterium]
MSPTLLPIAMDGRQWWVGQAAGDTFRTDGDFHGTALTIEIRTDDEARAVAAALIDQTTIPIGGTET